MRGGIAAQLALVVGLSDHLAVAHHDTHRHVAVLQRLRRLAERHPHECSSRGKTPRMAGHYPRPGRYPRPVRIISVNVGRPRTLEFDGRETTSAIVKEPVEGAGDGTPHR